MLSGQYTYLSYMMLSASCFFFWMMPNHHKIKALFRPYQKRASDYSKNEKKCPSAQLKRKRGQVSATEDKLEFKVQTRARAKLSENSSL